MKKKRGWLEGNQHAKKSNTKEQWSTRLPAGIIEQIKVNAAERGLAMAVYIEMLVKADNID